MSTENPYTAPTDTPLPVETGDERSLMEIAKSTFLAWEKLRIFYIAILAIFCIVCILVVSSVQANTMAGLSCDWVELLFMLIGGAVSQTFVFSLGLLSRPMLTGWELRLAGCEFPCSPLARYSPVFWRTCRL